MVHFIDFKRESEWHSELLLLVQPYGKMCACTTVVWVVYRCSLQSNVHNFCYRLPLFSAHMSPNRPREREERCMEYLFIFQFKLFSHNKLFNQQKHSIYSWYHKSIFSWAAIWIVLPIGFYFLQRAKSLINRIW